MRSTPEEDRLAKRLAVVERDNTRLREGPPTNVLSGCGDQSCLVQPAGSVGTNGGCHCSEIVLRRMVQWQAREIAKLRGEADECGDVAHRADRREVWTQIVGIGALVDQDRYAEASAEVDRLMETLGERHQEVVRLRALVDFSKRADARRAHFEE